MISEMSNIFETTSREVVCDHDFTVAVQEFVNQVASDESRPTSDEDPRPIDVHV
jgi:hypothetical protein